MGFHPVHAHIPLRSFIHMLISPSSAGPCFDRPCSTFGKVFCLFPAIAGLFSRGNCVNISRSGPWNRSVPTLSFGRGQPLKRKRLVDFVVRGEPPCLGAPDRGAAHDAAADRRVARCPPRQVSCRPQPAPRRCEHIECVPVVGALPAGVCALDESLQRCPLLASRRRVGAPPALDPDGCCDQLAGMRASGCCQRGVPAPFRRRERYACDLASRGGSEVAMLRRVDARNPSARDGTAAAPHFIVRADVRVRGMGRGLRATPDSACSVLTAFTRCSGAGRNRAGVLEAAEGARPVRPGPRKGQLRCGHDCKPQEG